MSFFDRAKQMVNGAVIWSEWLGPNKYPVDYETAQSRALTCLECPKHVKGNAVTESVAVAIKRQMELKKHLNLRVQGEKRLMTCGACQCPLRLKIWEQLSRVLPAPNEWDKYWEKCWLKTEKP